MKLDDGAELRDGCLRNHFEIGQSWPFDSGKGYILHIRFLGSGAYAEKDRSGGNRLYTFVAGKAA